MAPPPGVGSARVRRDSALSDEDVFHDDNKPTSPPVTQSPPKPKEEKILVNIIFYVYFKHKKGMMFIPNELQKKKMSYK